MDDKKRKQIFAGLVIIGISSLIAGGIIPFFINTTNLGSFATLSVEDPSDINDCHATIFSIGYGQQCLVTLSNTLETDPSNSITVDLIFISYEDYVYYTGLGTDPDSLSGSSYLRFQYTEIRYPESPTINRITHLDNLAEGHTYNIEFTGDGDSNYIYSRPGTYVLVVWSDNLGSALSALVGLSVNVEGIGDLINTICSWIGWISLAAAAIFALAYFITKRKR